MTRFVLVVYTNPVEGRDEEYNNWYSNRHLDDLLARHGVISARRLKLSSVQVGDVQPSHNYLALYEIEANDPQLFVDDLQGKVRNNCMLISPALADDANAQMWEIIEREPRGHRTLRPAPGESNDCE